MKKKYDYIALLEKQGSIALAPTESGAAESERCYVQMCKMLVADFLPPIAREDLAGLSYAFLDVARLSLRLGGDEGLSREVRIIIEGARKAASSCVAKEKACREITAGLEKRYSELERRVTAAEEAALTAGDKSDIIHVRRSRQLCDSLGELVRLLRSCVLRNL